MIAEINFISLKPGTDETRIMHTRSDNIEIMIGDDNKEDFYCLNCFRSYRTRNKLEAHKKICENHNYCNVEMPTKDNNIIKYNQGEKSIKLPFVVYADLECLLEKMSTCQNNPNEPSTTEINKHTIWLFNIPSLFIR